MIEVNIQKAKAIAHEKRRAARSAEFEPLDIRASIPGESAQADIARRAVRIKYEEIQLAIEAASNIESLKIAMAQIL